MTEVNESEIVICEGWDAAIAAKPDGYSIEVVYGRDGAGYVRYEPPSRPGNRGPRQPRYTEGFGWPVDSHPNIGAALMFLAQRPPEDAP